MKDGHEHLPTRRTILFTGVSMAALSAAAPKPAHSQAPSADGRATIEGYCSATSVVQGGSLNLHVRAIAPHAYFSIQVYRTGQTNTLLGTGFGTSFIPPAAQDDVTLAQQGCGWPVSATLAIAPTWPSGLYYAVLTSYADATGQVPLGATTTVGFVVRPAAPGSQTRILLCITDTTYQAYNEWGGRSLYTTPQAVKVSYDRPYYVSENSLPVGSRELPFIQWAERNAIGLDFCASADLHVGSILENYYLLLSVGHDEYWSKQMFDNAQNYVARAGNICFFSGNVVYWQIRLEDNLRTLVSYKQSASLDPIQNPAQGGPTAKWADVGRPPNLLVGAGFRFGAWWSTDVPATPARLRGYTVQHADHWVYAGTGLVNRSVFGLADTIDHTIVGHETDAAHYEFDSAGIAQPTGVDGSPSDFLILAYADLTDWAALGDRGQGGYATMGLYERAGTVFTAGTIDWAAGLRPETPGSPVKIITRNLITNLSRREN